MNVHAKEIYDFGLSGTISEVNLEKQKLEVERYFEAMLKDDGYLIHLDIDPNPVWEMEYNIEKEAYDFKLTMYVVREEDSWSYAGRTNGLGVPKYIPTNK